VDELVVALPRRGALDLHEFELCGLLAFSEHEHADVEPLGVGEAGVGGERGLDRKALQGAKADSFGVEADRGVEVADHTAEINRGAGERRGLGGEAGQGGAGDEGEDEAAHEKAPGMRWAIAADHSTTLDEGFTGCGLKR
jgi:hypothetical protein